MRVERETRSRTNKWPSAFFSYSQAARSSHLPKHSEAIMRVGGPCVVFSSEEEVYAARVCSCSESARNDRNYDVTTRGQDAFMQCPAATGQQAVEHEMPPEEENLMPARGFRAEIWMQLDARCPFLFTVDSFKYNACGVTQSRDENMMSTWKIEFQRLWCLVKEWKLFLSIRKCSLLVFFLIYCDLRFTYFYCIYFYFPWFIKYFLGVRWVKRYIQKRAKERTSLLLQRQSSV